MNDKYSVTTWKYSDVEYEQEPSPVAGEWPVKIVHASYDDEKDRYMMTLKDLVNNVTFSVRYNLSRADAVTGVTTSNFRARNTLVGLGQAVFGESVGIPAPEDLVGAVANAVVKLSIWQGKEYANVYEYHAANEVYVLGYSDIEQHSTGE